jgi:hypothetical protein
LCDFSPADDERGRFAICQMTGCLSHVRTRHVGQAVCDTGGHALYAWRRLVAVAESSAFTHLHRLPALRPAFDCASLSPADDERGRFVICWTIGWLSHVRICHVVGPRRWPACAARLAAALGSGGEAEPLAGCVRRLPAGRDANGSGALEPRLCASQCRTHLVTAVAYSGSHRWILIIRF